MGVILRTLVTLAVLGSVAGSAWYYQRHLTHAAEVAALEAKADRLEGVVERLAREERVAEMIVTDQRLGDDGVLVTDLLFSEYGDDGRASPPVPFTVRGETVHVAAKLIKFDRALLTADEEGAGSGETMALFTGVHGGAEAPEDARPLEPEDVAATDAVLWEQFWELARDEALRERYGVRVAHGQTTWAAFEPGVLYTLTLEADGGLGLEQAAIPAVFRGAAGGMAGLELGAELP